MDTDRITELKDLLFQEADWAPADRPVLIADGRVLRINELSAPVCARVACVVGVNQPSFANLCRLLRAETLHFHDMRVADIRPLTAIRGLKQLAIRWNNRLADLSPLAQLRQLQVLLLEDTPKVFDLGPISRCSALSALECSGGLWRKNSVASLEPLAELPLLEHLVLTNLKIQAGGLRPLAGCKRLRRLQLSNQFPTEEYAFLSVALPAVACCLFAPYVQLHQPIDGKDIMVVGSRKPFLSSRQDAARLEKYAKAFAALRDHFTQG